jgi:protein SCO1/2
MSSLNGQLIAHALNDALVDALRHVSFDAGNHYQVVVVSFDPRETADLAAAKKVSYVESYGRLDAAGGWHFLTSEQPSIDALTQAVGFRYSYDATNDKFAHASGIVLLTPSGRIARYFYGIHFSPRDLRLGLVEASENKIGSPVDQVLLYCYHYDAAGGGYTATAMTVVRLGGVLTVVALGAFMLVSWQRNRRRGEKPLPQSRGNGTE